MSKITFELEAEQVDEIVKQTLIDSYRSIKQENRLIRRRKDFYDLPDHIKEDYTNNLTLIDALEHTLKYFTLHKEVDNIIEEEDDKDSRDAEDYDLAHGTPPINGWDEPNTDERIQILEDKVYDLEKQLARYEYNRNVDL
jgi:hypothetical protein